MKQWLSDMQKEVHVLGPLLPAGYGIEIEHGEDGVAGTDVETFLGKMLVQHGKRSVFFVTFFLSGPLSVPAEFCPDFLWHHPLAPGSRVY